MRSFRGQLWNKKPFSHDIKDSFRVCVRACVCVWDYVVMLPSALLQGRYVMYVVVGCV